MKEKGIVLNNVCYTYYDLEKYGKKLPSIVKSISLYSPKDYSLKKLIDRKVEIRKIDSETTEFEMPSYQTKVYERMFWRF